MRRLYLALIVSIALVAPVFAQIGMPWPGPGTPASTASASTRTVWLNNGAMFVTIGARTVWSNIGAVKQ